ncbi:MAG: NTP transferase domain-containing protein [Atopobiaceae bacterium]|nr:NTP transferase domain-containing protein [Atopobiaceae bacterium]
MKLFPSINPVIAGDAGRIFGPGPAELLERTRATGSLHAAASEMGMAYSKATRIIRTAEDGLGYALLERKRGGTAGGGSALTFEAELLLARYDAWRTEASAAANALYEQRFARVGCVVMASGDARRFGSNKLLAPFAGTTVLEHTLAALPAELLEVRVVTRSADVAALAESCGATAVLHDGPLQSDTVRAGLAAIGDAPACLFVPGDQPLLSAASVRALVLASVQHPEAIVRLAHDGAPGSPVIWPCSCFDALAVLEGDVGGSELLRTRPDFAFRVILVEAARACELLDIDTPEQLDELERYVLRRTP